ncbi:cysteine hydrolase [Candidatus Woesearchaeota archaeon]|nr:cysteine hydrolase [Candidatus Woesearchaeota archaeon]
MRTIFWNVDTQYDFMRDDEEHKGALPIDDAKSIEKNLELLTNYAREKDFLTINSADEHTFDDEEISDTPDFIMTFPPHCMRGTKGVEYIPATKPGFHFGIHYDEEILDLELLHRFQSVTIYKNKFDVFTGNPHTEDIVESLKPATAIVYGVATNVCVDFAVMGLLEREVTVYVVQDAIKELPNLPLEETLNKWKEAGAKFITTHEVVKPGGLGTILEYAAFDLEDQSRFEREQRSYTE